ncbi:hypothetical protein BOS5A_80048 [Bosea sp. EC-HK365B]|nr:hypothetical protein BOSE7B_20198 [Bosea sp. 7B]VVT62388.1 hypothetical protein BOS5A_80048 [Bosea sp. EC-HK365B]
MLQNRPECRQLMQLAFYPCALR